MYKNNGKESMASHYAKNEKKQPLLIDCSFTLILKRFAWPFNITGEKKKQTLRISIGF
jgi:hypothetical protein